MKGFVKFLVVVSSVMCFTTAFSSNEKVVAKMNNWAVETQSAQFVDTFYYEDFESGAPGWVSVDLTDIPGTWHPDTFQAYGGSGKSWWMGDTLIGGYLDSWYQVLDSPEIILPAGACTLRFMMNRAVEDPAGAQSPYDGWDGVNVRISADEGSTWTVLLNPTPAYGCASMYSFGFEHGEGPGIPGWGGSSGGWVSVAFDLSAYAEDTVKIRWAFASDPAYCTTDNPGLFGVQIDDIDVAGVLSNDGEDTVGFTRTSQVPIGGDLWHITEDAGCPSPTNAAWCGDSATGTYAPNMNNAYVSPPIPLPAADTILAQFWVRGGLHDPDAFPENDYFGAQLSPDSGKTWFYVSNPTGDTLDTNFVYPMAPNTPWSLFLPVNVSMYAGGALMFRIWLHSDGDAPGDSSEGLFMDDFYLYTKETGVEEEYSEMSFKLWENLPNPAVNKALIRFSVSKPSDVSLRIYDIAGQLVRILVNEPTEAGVNSVMWDSRDSNGKLVPAGIYFYELKAGELKETKKLILLR